VISEELSRYDDIDIIGTAVDPYVARDKIVELRPDVITLDLEMPRMDGLSFLTKLMKHFPMPVVVLSSLTPKNSELALKALDLGAVEVLCKPGGAYSTKNISRDLALAIRSAAVARVGRPAVKPRAAAEPVDTSKLLVKTTHKVIAIDAGHVGQNLYLACESLGAGTCAIGAYDQDACDRLLGVDGKEEFTVYLAPVGKR